ncbi:unnamed protein product [Coffea canephora]|uniref:Uncharacterized protein n=1 Tax=Coffea canephora TaxID=49390 RepID=A0A068TZM0_COFCA|nr:unnamed protein product [Coffea canephora]
MNEPTENISRNQVSMRAICIVFSSSLFESQFPNYIVLKTQTKRTFFKQRRVSLHSVDGASQFPFPTSLSLDHLLKWNLRGPCPPATARSEEDFVYFAGRRSIRT